MHAKSQLNSFPNIKEEVVKGAVQLVQETILEGGDLKFSLYSHRKVGDGRLVVLYFIKTLELISEDFGIER